MARSIVSHGTLSAPGTSKSKKAKKKQAKRAAAFGALGGPAEDWCQGLQARGCKDGGQEGEGVVGRSVVSFQRNRVGGAGGGCCVI